MEITIDFPTVRRITSQEYAQACAEIAQAGPVPAYRQSQQRHDERLAAAPDANTLACKAGCFWCCYFTVDVRPVEIFPILDFIETRFTPQEQARVRDEIAANSAALMQLDEEQRMRRNIKCPFLAEGRCTIYAVRPQTCRNYHATNASGCQRSFEEPDNLDIDPEFAPLVYQSGGAHVDAFSKAMSEAGYDVGAYEMNTALAVALADPAGVRVRFDAKQSAFARLEGAEVPLEFMEMDEE